MQYVADNSIFQWLLIVVSYLMAEPNMRAIMQNLTATSLWELGRVACRAFHFRKGIDSRPTQVVNLQVADRPDDLKTVMLAAINVLSDRGGEVTIKTQKSRYEKTEMTIKVTAETTQATSLSLSAVKRARPQHQHNSQRMLFD